VRGQNFLYLENKYPAIYDKKLSAPDCVTARNYLGEKMDPYVDPDNPGWKNGVTSEQWWEGKVRYMEGVAPGATVYAGMSYEDPSTWGNDVNTTTLDCRAHPISWGLKWSSTQLVAVNAESGVVVLGCCVSGGPRPPA
jgi:hypothetical protein